MTTSTPGRMPVIAFSDNADYDTLNSVLGREWCVDLVMRDSTRRQVSLDYGPDVDDADDDYDDDIDYIGGKTWNEETGRWNGPEFYVPLDDVVQIIVL